MQRGGARRFRASVLCRCILRPVDTSDVPAGTSLHRLPLHCRPARIAVSAFASISLIPVAGQQCHVGTYRQVRPLFFKMNGCRHSAQTLIKRQDAKGRPAEVLFWERHWLARGGSVASVLCSSSILRPVETSDAPAGTSLHRLSCTYRGFCLCLLISDWSCRPTRECRDVPTRCVRRFSK